jgi:hypothetical protein
MRIDMRLSFHLGLMVVLQFLPVGLALGRSDTYRTAADYLEYPYGVEGYVAQSQAIVVGAVVAREGECEALGQFSYTYFRLQPRELVYSSPLSAIIPDIQRGSWLLAVPCARSGAAVAIEYDLLLGETYLFFLRRGPDTNSYYAVRGPFGRVPMGPDSGIHEVFGDLPPAVMLEAVRLISSSVRILDITGKGAILPRYEIGPKHWSGFVAADELPASARARSAGFDGLVVLPPVLGRWLAKGALGVGDRIFLEFDWVKGTDDSGVLAVPVSLPRHAAGVDLLLWGPF